MTGPEQEAFAAVFVTTSTAAEADHIAAVLVGERLAACVNRLGPVRSTYTWKGELTRNEEFLLVIKARRQRIDQLASRVRALHSYEVPEVVALPIVAGSPPYLRWLGEATDPAPPGGG